MVPPIANHMRSGGGLLTFSTIGAMMWLRVMERYMELHEKGMPGLAWELARRVAAALGLPAHAKVLLRPVETAQHQAELSREQRLSNLRGAFAVDDRRRKLLTGRRVSLVDDVLTTGATAQEATLALLRAGACAVDLWVLARTPEH